MRPELCPIATFHSKDHCSPRKHAHYYGRDRIATLFPRWTGPHHAEMHQTAWQRCLLWTGPRLKAYYTMDGTALQRCLVWTGPRRAALKRALLWRTGPRRVGAETPTTTDGTVLQRSFFMALAHCYGQGRTETLFTWMSQEVSKWLVNGL